MSAAVRDDLILVVDDDDTFRNVLAAELRRRGHEVACAANGSEALDGALRFHPAVVLLDMRLPDMAGIEVLTRLREREAEVGVIVLTGHGTIDTAIQATRMGAYDYLEKPCPMEKVELAIRKAIEHRSLVARQKVLQDGYAPPDFRRSFVGQSAEFRHLLDLVTRVARADTTTLIVGETGVGKEMVAAMLHAESPRGGAPFVVVDCAALDEELLRSELFGHEKGAFTGATRQKHGLFEVASGGTLFLDEVGEASPEIQSKLLRVLETGCFRHIGGNREISVDLRVVSATNRDLAAEIDRGRFREDLYFRLSTLVVEVPPLREHADDIPLLVEHFTARLNRRLRRTVTFSKAAVDVLVRHPWRGNVRQLIHVLEQTIVMADGDEAGPEDLPPAVLGARPEPNSRARPGELATLREMQRVHTHDVLESVGGNRAEAARILGVTERHLYRLLRKHAGFEDTETP